MKTNYTGVLQRDTDFIGSMDTMSSFKKDNKDLMETLYDFIFSHE